MLYKPCQNFYVSDSNNSILYKNTSSQIHSNCTYIVDTRLGELSLILPANPETGDIIVLLDPSNYWNVNNVTVINNTKKIAGKYENLIINIYNISLTLIYVGDNSFYGWMIHIENTLKG